MFAAKDGADGNGWVGEVRDCAEPTGWSVVRRRNL